MSRPSVPRWLFVVLLVQQAHFAASHLVPLDEQARHAFWGLLPWAWPWALGDHGPLGRIATIGWPVLGAFTALAAGAACFLAALALMRWWVPPEWWRPLSIAGGALSIVLMLLFFGATKVLPTAAALAILAVGLDYWSVSTTTP